VFLVTAVLAACTPPKCPLWVPLAALGLVVATLLIPAK
jgi:hypothetical protein